MTPRPRNATFAIIASLTVRDRVECPYEASDCDGAAAASTRCALGCARAPLTGRSRTVWWRNLSPEYSMAVTKDDVLASLARVSSPDGTPLPKSGALSDVLATDGKVFFSITVDAAEVKAWESVRKQAEEVVRAMPGVVSAMVALTAE